VDFQAPLPANTEVVVPASLAVFGGQTSGRTRQQQQQQQQQQQGEPPQVAAADAVSARTVYYADEGETLASIAMTFSLDAATLVALNAALYKNLTADVPLLQDTPVYVHVASSAGRSLRGQPTIMGQSAKGYDHGLKSCCFLYHAKENDSAGKLGSRFGVDFEDIIRLNNDRHPGLSRVASLRKDTALYIPWNPDGNKIDLAYAFSKLDGTAQPSFPDPSRHLCLFVANARDNIKKLCDRLGLEEPGHIVRMNEYVHDELTATVRCFDAIGCTSHWFYDAKFCEHEH
jgi:hypothetical protein